MIRMRPIEQINEKRIARSILAYLEGQPNCSLKWILGVISVEAALAASLLSQFSQYAGAPRYQELQDQLSVRSV
jgi:hypothetical protein